MATDGGVAAGVQVCSCKVDTPQLISPGTAYKMVRFPYGAAESTDRFEMHQAVQPDGYVVSDWETDDRSGLIWPSKAGWGQLHAMIQWESASGTTGYTELRDQYVRDPLGLTPTTMPPKGCCRTRTDLAKGALRALPGRPKSAHTRAVALALDGRILS